MKRYIAIFLLSLSLLYACIAQPTQTTPQLINIYISDSAYSRASVLYDCASASTVFNLSDPQSADIALRLGEPDHLITPAYQISTEDIIAIVHPQTGIGSLTLDQVRAIFLGQILNWKDVGGKDLSVQVWSYPDVDIQEILIKSVMNGQPVTSLAHLATSAQVMQGLIEAMPGSIGILPYSLLEGSVTDVYKVATVPVLAITRSEPHGAVREIISCLQEKH